MTFEMIATWVVVGAAAGSLAGFVMKRGGSGPTGDIPLGLVGSIVGSWAFWAVGVAPDAGPLAMAGVAFLGAAGLLVAQRRFWPTMG